MAEKKRFLLRVDQRTYDALEKWAEDEFRSVNAQIEIIIKKALKDAGRLKNSKTANDANKDE
ncbi:Arc family DNA-binding protein [Neobacillus sp. OS1-32]|uniref:Arc family DNA-binding protein n=1 Tax=Neobacillus sp. OS1-32 TaxID=3070682 RepID=UPI0027DF2FA5|nr:Arc family DNA-binding protein [Neobacillus sp. OS1-32]WML29284.1 Arc family DNA-binding protein [Neobacillus sp. OS1-32]